MRRGSALLVGLLAVAGCREPPSWAARWRIADRDDPEAEPEVLTNGEQCSRVGLSLIQLSTVAPFGRGGFLVDSRVKPCWAPAMRNPERTLGGPAVPPGEYDLVAIGLGANGQRWCRPGLVHTCNPAYVRAGQEPPSCGEGFVPSVDVEARTYGVCVEESTCDYCNDPFWIPTCEPDGGCHPSYMSCDCITFTAIDGETVHIRDLVIDPPPECEDGIDNDGDGLVDERDPGCQSSQREDTDIITTQLLVDISLLSSNPAATCFGVGLSRFDISLDGRVVASPACDIGRFAVNIEVSAGPHEVGILGLAPVGQPLTREHAFTVEALVGGVLSPQLLEVDFADTDFLEPIQAPAQFLIGFETAPGVPTQYCSDTSDDPRILDIDELTIRLVDAVGDLVQPAVRIDYPLPGMRLDGSPVPCVARAIITDPVPWGVYKVEVEAFSAEGDVCFSNVGAPDLLAPSSTASIVLPRVRPKPASCRECGNDDHCGGGTHCENGVCVL